MSEIYNLLEQVASTTKKTEKIDILNNNKDNLTLQRVISNALNPYQQYYIKKIPEYTSDESSVMSIDVFLDHITDFSERTVTGHAAIEHLTQLLSSLTPEDAEVATRIIRKDLRCGMGDSTVNKVWKKLIPTYPCLLGKAYDEKTIRSIVYPAYSQNKADGMRANVFYETSKSGTPVITIRGRSGRVVDLRGHFDDAFIVLGSRQSNNIVFDGELVVLEKDLVTVMPRKTGNGILNKAIKGTISDEEASRVRMRLWDTIPYDDFKAEKCKIPYSTRFNTTIALCGTDTFANTKYEMIQYRIVHGLSEALDAYSDALANGEEGIMLKNMKALWENKRSPNLVKFKAEKECELEVIGYNPGSVGTKLEGKLGSLICASSDRVVEVSISGFSDELREDIFNNIQNWIGMIVTVKYNEVIEDRNRPGVYSLFLPRFVELRLDKQVADHSSTIK